MSFCCRWCKLFNPRGKFHPVWGYRQAHGAGSLMALILLCVWRCQQAHRWTAACHSGLACSAGSVCVSCRSPAQGRNELCWSLAEGLIARIGWGTCAGSRDPVVDCRERIQSCGFAGAVGVDCWSWLPEGRVTAASWGHAECLGLGRSCWIPAHRTGWC